MLSVKQDEPEGYSASVCIRCENKDSVQYQQFAVQQILRCHERLSEKAVIVEANVGNTDDEGVLRYKRDPIVNRQFGGRYRPKSYTTIIDDTFDTFFNNENSDDKCPVTMCRLMAPGCIDSAVSDTT